jgi:SOS response regulatory protein OraA/RecX
LEGIDEEIYMQALKETIDIKRRELKGKDDFATQQKIIRHAASRGYEPALIMKTIKYKGDEMDF